MKKLIMLLLVAGAIMSAGYSAFAQEDTPAAGVIVYYFHGTFRCPTCTTMEKYSREAIETNFKEARAAGKLEFHVVNVEERGNEHFVNDYQLYTKALIVSLVKGGKEIRAKNLDAIWEYARNRQRFIEYVTAEINGFLKDAH